MWRMVAFAPGHARGARPQAEVGLGHAGCRSIRHRRRHCARHKCEFICDGDTLRLDGVTYRLINIVEVSEVQSCVASTGIAAQPHLPVGLGKGPDRVTAIR
jgi:hypothetical protein